jgi:hypothetical protein
MMLVNALGALPELHSSTAAPDVATPGAAWPRWVQSTYDGRLCTVTADTYDVYVVLPGDYLATTVERGDELRDDVEPVLARVSRIQYAEPVQIQFNDHQTMPGIRFRVSIR